MGKITKIEVQKGSPRRRSIFLNGEFALAVEEEAVFRHHLREGDDLSDDAVEELQSTEERRRAENIALRLLGHRARSNREVEDRLKERGFGEAIIAQVVETLNRRDLLDDNEFARSWISDRLRNKPIAKRLLRRELHEKGVAPSIIDTAIEELYDRSEEEVAAELLKKRWERFRGSDERKARGKMAAFLARRGFCREVIGEVLRDPTVSSLFSSNAVQNGSMGHSN